jgi:hypothetical protein
MKSAFVCVLLASLTLIAGSVNVTPGDLVKALSPIADTMAKKYNCRCAGAPACAPVLTSYPPPGSISVGIKTPAIDIAVVGGDSDRFSGRKVAVSDKFVW